MNDAAPSIRLVVADMAGTIADFGSCAPASAFVRLFEMHDIQLTDAQAREPMGLEKRDHIAALLQMPAIAKQWIAAHGEPWSETDVDRLYEEFIPLQVSVLPEYNELIPGAAKALEQVRRMGIAVGGTTGYNREMMGVVVRGMRDQGLNLDAAVCAEDVAGGRPAPWMMYRVMELTDSYPPSRVLKIGDTLPDVEAGLRAGAWSVGVTVTGNMVGLRKAEWERLPNEEQDSLHEAASEKLFDAGAHYVLHEIHELPSLIEKLNRRMADGEGP